MNAVAAAAVGVLFGCGVHLMVRGDAVKLAAGTLLVSNAAVLLLVVAGAGPYRAPFLPVAHAAGVADPLVQALALTAVVIGFGTSVLLLRVAMALARTHAGIEMEELVEAEVAESDDPDPSQGEARP